MRPTILTIRVLVLAATVAVALPGRAQSGAEKPSCEQTSPPRKTTTTSSTKPNGNITQDVQVFCCPKDSPSTSVPQKPEKPVEEKSTDYAKLLEAISKLFGSIAWPAAAVFIAYHFKNELAALLARLKKVKAGSAEAEFERGVDEAIVAAGIEGEAPPTEVSSTTFSAAASDPRGAILGAWLEVERAIYALLDARGLNVPAPRPMRGVLPAMKAIQKAGALAPEYIGLFHDLRSLRNAAAHNLDFNPEPDAVIHYTRLAKALSQAINEAANVVG